MALVACNCLLENLVISTLRLSFSESILAAINAISLSSYDRLETIITVQ